MENSVVIPQKLEIESPYIIAIPPQDIYPEELKTGTCTGTCTPVNCCIIHSSWEEEAAQLFVNRQMNQLNVVDKYRGMLFSPKKEGASVWHTPQGGYVLQSEVSQSQKHKYSLMPLLWGT